MDDEPEDDARAAVLDHVAEILTSDGISARSVGRALGVRMAKRPAGGHPYRFRAAVLDDAESAGVVRVHFKEPRAGAGARLLTLEFDPPCPVPLADLGRRFGPFQIDQIIPNAAPEGLVSYGFETGGPLGLSATFTTTSARLASITITAT